MSLPRRIVVMLGGHDEAAAMQAAAMLAGATGASLAGLFVEDQELLDLAGLPQMMTFAGPAGQLTLDRMERAFREEARRCRKIMAELAGHANLSFEFASIRGDRRTLLDTATLEGDIVLCQASLGGPAAGEVIASARRSARAAAGVALIGPLARLGPGPVVAIDDGDACGRETVALAARLAARRRVPMVVLVLAEHRKSAEAISARAHTIAGHTDFNARILPSDDATRLAEELAEIQPCCVVGDLEGRPFGNDQAVAGLARAARAPLILLRSPAM